MRSLQVGDEVNVTYASEDPSRAVLDTSFPWYEGVIAAVCGIGFIAAMITIFYSWYGSDSDAAEQYDKLPQESSKQSDVLDA